MVNKSKKKGPGCQTLALLVSLDDQRDEQLGYCARENLEVVKEFEDPGYLGKFLESPDLDELRDLVTTGGLDVVVVSKRDRLARGVYAGYLKNEFKRRGVELVALDTLKPEECNRVLQDALMVSASGTAVKL